MQILLSEIQQKNESESESESEIHLFDPHSMIQNK